jgi:hypothetical protein
MREERERDTYRKYSGERRKSLAIVYTLLIKYDELKG